MARPLDILNKMLDLEARDYRYQDRAVAGGLARYADTWRRQTGKLFGEASQEWVDGVAELLQAYSAASVDQRRETVVVLQEMLRTGPHGEVSELADDNRVEPLAAPPIVEPPEPALPQVSEVTASAPSVMEDSSQTAVSEPVAIPLAAVASSDPTADPVGDPALAEPAEDSDLTPAAGGDATGEPDRVAPAESVVAGELAEAMTQAEEQVSPDVDDEAVSQLATGRGLDASVTLISGVGEKRASLLENLGISTIADFLYHMPRRYEDYSQLKTIDQLTYGERVSVLATVWETGSRTTHRGKRIFKAVFSDTTGTMEVTWFGARGLGQRLQRGAQVLLSGQVGEYLGRLTMTSPDWEIVGRTEITNARIQPVYPLTDGLTQRWMRSTVRRVLSSWADRIPDPLPGDLRSRFGLLSLPRALWGVHLPDGGEHLAASRRRLAFEQTLYLQLGLVHQKRLLKAQAGRRIESNPERVAALTAALPYELTGAQRRSLDEMLSDLASGQPMNRLLQGDVGSGKTVVAALAMVAAADEGCQAAMMAPTEILAEQHFKSLTGLFESLPNPRPTVGLLTGSTSQVDREAMLHALADGSLQVVVGTHALIQDPVVFNDLGLVVVDEQHRFGVDQRQALRDKGISPHLLVMTATPIPRSLELTIWGHLDVSVLDEMPPGRQPIRTRVLHPRERGRAYTFVQSQVGKGRQAFIVTPLVESSEKVDAPAAVDEAERLQRDVFPRLRVGLLHGRMRSDEKDGVMTAFASGELDVLVATSVVEVGIDVPNATVMLVDGADRFGLAQLHQFRGRVGRGPHPSYCLLLTEVASAGAAERLQALEATTDGFVLAEKDLEMRGPGEFLGTHQSGFPELPMAAFADTRLLREVRTVAEELLETDPELSQPSHQLLRMGVAAFWSETADFS